MNKWVSRVLFSLSTLSLIILPLKQTHTCAHRLYLNQPAKLLQKNGGKHTAGYRYGGVKRGNLIITVGLHRLGQFGRTVSACLILLLHHLTHHRSPFGAFAQQPFWDRPNPEADSPTGSKRHQIKTRLHLLLSRAKRTLLRTLTYPKQPALFLLPRAGKIPVKYCFYSHLLKLPRHTCVV